MQMEISELSNQGSIEVKGWKISPYLQALVIIHNQYVYTYKDMIRQKDRNPIPYLFSFLLKFSVPKNPFFISIQEQVQIKNITDNDCNKMKMKLHLK